MAILEEYNVNTVEILWEYYGNAVGTMWEDSGNAMAIYGMSMSFWGDHRGNTIRMWREYYYSLIYKSMGIT